MNCDLAFESMTDRNRRGGGELQRHLDNCPRCRQMRETLAPAFDLFDAAGAHESPERVLREAAGAAGDWHDPNPNAQPLLLSSEAVRVAQSVAAELAQGSRPARLMRRTRLASLLRYAAVFLAGAACSLGVAILCTDATEQNVVPFALTDCTFKYSAQAGALKLDAHSAVVTCVGCHLDSSQTRVRRSANASSISVVNACIACHLTDLPTSRQGAFEPGAERFSSSRADDSQRAQIAPTHATSCLWPGVSG